MVAVVDLGKSRPLEPDWRTKHMKRVIFGLMIAVLLAALAFSVVGCEQAQQAIDTLDRAKAVKADAEKKAKEIQDKARGLISGNNGEASEKQSDKGGEEDD
jgi:hypothetical protein